jgi:hypothetical protein
MSEAIPHEEPMPHDTLFITDLHGNLEALRRAVERAEQVVPLRYLILGGDLAPNLVAVRLRDGEFVLRHEASYGPKVADDFRSRLREGRRYRPEDEHGKRASIHPISILFPRTWGLFDRELEKVVSLSASMASATFSLACGTRACFDSRAVLAAEGEQVVDYFRWRQADAARCALNGWCYWSLGKRGQSVAEATKALEGKSVAEKNELLFQAGTNFNEVPLWQRRGTGLYWETYQRQGHNPKRNETVIVTRKRIKVDGELPMGTEYADFITHLLRTGMAATTTITEDDPAQGE